MMAGFTSVASQEIALIVITAFLLALAAWKTDQPTVVAYLAAGIVLGPAALNLAQETEFTRLLSELGLGFLLFFIGLEVKLEDVKEIAKPVTLIATLSIALLGFLGFATGQLLNFSSIESLILACAAGFSSTAVVVKMLSDRDEIQTLPGKIDVGMLLIQDLAVVIVLTAFSLENFSINTIGAKAAKLAAFLIVLVPVATYAARHHLKKVFSSFGDDRHVFIIQGLAWLFAFIELSRTLGLSVEIGAFIAGLSIAQLPYSDELKQQVRPLTDLFIALFFVNIGLKITGFGSYLVEAAAVIAVFMLGKFFINYFLIDRLSFTSRTAFDSSANMIQISEFALVVTGAAAASGLVGNDFLSFISVVTATSIVLSSYVINSRDPIYEKLKPVLNYMSSENASERSIEPLEDHAILLGYDEVGRKIAEVLAENFELLVVDNNPENVEKLSSSEHQFIYGSFNHEEIRDACRVEKASFLISVTSNLNANQKLVEDAAKGVPVFVEASSIEEAADLYDLGAHYVMMNDKMAAEQVLNYMEMLENDSESFQQARENYIQQLKWGERESQN